MRLTYAQRVSVCVCVCVCVCWGNYNVRLFRSLVSGVCVLVLHSTREFGEFTTCSMYWMPVPGADHMHECIHVIPRAEVNTGWISPSTSGGNTWFKFWSTYHYYSQSLSCYHHHPLDNYKIDILTIGDVLVSVVVFTMTISSVMIKGDFWVSLLNSLR